MTLAAIVLGLALLGGPIGPASPAKSQEAARTLQESARVTLRTVRLRVDTVRGSDPGECAALDLDDLAVSLRGDRLPRDLLIDLERRQVPTLHALLIDTSASMVGKLGFVRDAAKDYVRHLRPGLDRALLATFDEDTVLVQAATDDQEALLAGIDRVRMGEATSLHDGLYRVIDELNTHRERPVVVVLTDGIDTASHYERDDVNALARRRPDLMVFAIAYALPPIHAGRAGMSSAKRFLQNLATRTGGEFFDVPTASRLDPAYLRIRQMLASEAVLTLTDPEPQANVGRVKVRSEVPACRVTVFREEPDPKEEDTAPTTVAERFNGKLPLPPSAPFRVRYGLPGSTDIPSSCAAAAQTLPDDACFIDALPDRLSGCVLDVVMDDGMLYSTLEVTRWEINDWIELRIRPFQIAVPELAELPEDPAELLDDLAAQVLAVAESTKATDYRKQPAGRHARPFVDFPTVINGRTFLDVRGALAAALFRYRDYEDWTRTRRAREAERDRTALFETFRRLAPALSENELNEVVDASAAGRRLARRVEDTSADELRGSLGAWLGDVSAYDLFRRWEIRHANRMLAGEDPGSFLAAWSALHRVFFLPSYARILALLHPVHDPEQDRIGFWRVLLPRVSWFLPRVQNAERHPEFGDLPLDLVPDHPLGFWALKVQRTLDRAAATQLQAGGYRVTTVDYELRGKPWKRDPPRAFRDVRVTVDLESEREPGSLRLVADMRIAPDGAIASIVHCEWKGERAAVFPQCVTTPPSAE